MAHQALIEAIRNEFDLHITKGRRSAMMRAAGVEPTSETVEEFKRLVEAEQVRRDNEKAAKRDADRETAMAAGFDLKVEGRREIVSGTSADDFDLRDDLKSLGFHWDPQTKDWWRGKREDDSSVWSALAKAAAARQTDPSSRSVEAAGDQFERDMLETVEPHWPTYRAIMSLQNDLMELFDALRHGDWKDVQFLQQAWKELVWICNHVENETVANLLRECHKRRAMSRGKLKRIAVIVSKSVAIQQGAGK